MFKTPSTKHRFQTKTILFCSGYGYRPHYNAENDQRKRIVSKTLSGVERFENGTVQKRCFPSVDGENDAIWKRWHHHNKTTGLQTAEPWVSKMFQVASLLIAVNFSLLTLLEAHLTLLRLFIDFSRREQDIIRLLSLPASGGTRVKRLGRSPLDCEQSLFFLLSLSSRRKTSRTPACGILGEGLLAV